MCSAIQLCTNRNPGALPRRRRLPLCRRSSITLQASSTPPTSSPHFGRVSPRDSDHLRRSRRVQQQRVPPADHRRQASREQVPLFGTTRIGEATGADKGFLVIIVCCTLKGAAKPASWDIQRADMRKRVSQIEANSSALLAHCIEEWDRKNPAFLRSSGYRWYGSPNKIADQKTPPLFS